MQGRENPFTTFGSWFSPGQAAEGSQVTPLEGSSLHGGVC